MSDKQILQYSGTREDIAKAIRKLGYIERISYVNQAAKYIAEHGAFEIKDGKLTVNIEKLPANIFLNRNATTKYVELIIKICNK